MNLTARIITAAMAAAATFGVLPATASAATTSAAAAQAQTQLPGAATISYRDGDRRHFRGKRDYRRHHHSRSHRQDWRRHNWRRDHRRYSNNWRHRPHYRQQRCWTELRWDRWRSERYRVRICR